MAATGSSAPKERCSSSSMTSTFECQCRQVMKWRRRGRCGGPWERSTVHKELITSVHCRSADEILILWVAAPAWNHNGRLWRGSSHLLHGDFISVANRLTIGTEPTGRSQIAPRPSIAAWLQPTTPPAGTTANPACRSSPVEPNHATRLQLIRSMPSDQAS
jgi:hypothetical protein